MSGSLGRWATAAIGLSLSGCGASAPAPAAPAGRIGASIVVLRGGDVAVADQDHASVSILDGASLTVIRTIPVGGEPRTLLELASGRLLVASHRAGELALVDPGGGQIVRRAPVCAGPIGLAASPDESFVAVSCEWDGRVLRVDPGSLDARELAHGLVRPRPVAVVGTHVLVGEYTGGRVVELSEDGPSRPISLTPTTAPYRPALTEMTANLLSGIAVAGSRILVAHELVNHTGNTTTEVVSDDYGSVTDGNPKINPALSSLILRNDNLQETEDAVLYARFDGGSRVFSGPSAVTAIDDRRALVANEGTRNVALVDLDASDPEVRAVASFSVGAGPSGIAVDAAGTHAYVDNAFDGSVSRLDLTVKTGVSAPVYAPEVTRVRPLGSTYSSAALAGRKVFHDASDPHVTPSGIVSCATCHPEGGDDGLVWFVHTKVIPLKRRRTPNLANSHSGTEPFHWDGQFASMTDLVQHTITDLMAGDALLVDLDSVRAYIDEIVQAPVPPPASPASVERGRAEYVALGCGTCHSGKELTDDALHTVLSPVSLSADDVVTEINTPGLFGAFLRAPYFHDGRSPSLDDLLTRGDASAHGGSTLAPSDRADLIAYLESL